MKLEEFVSKVEKMAKNKKGFKIVVHFKMNSRGLYIADLEVLDWKYEGLFSFGHNFDFGTMKFSTYGYNHESFEGENLEELIDLVYEEIVYVNHVYNALKQKDIDVKYEFNF